MAAIVTLTLNPALDITTSADVVKPTHKIRCSSATAEAGGGGVNVARVAGRLGTESLAILPLGGGNGRRLAHQLDIEGIAHIDVAFDGETRQSFTVNELSSDEQFRFVVPGEAIDPETLRKCRDAVIAASGDAACLAISGSLPDGVPSGFITELIAEASELGVQVVVDTSGPAMVEALSTPARLLKPSARELSSVVGRDLITETDVEAGLLEVMATARCGAVVVSIGAGGAMMLDRNEGFLRFRAPTVRVASAVGAGDSMVAGMTVVLARGGSMADAVHLGIAAGTATVLTAGSQLCHRRDVEALHALVQRSV